MIFSVIGCLLFALSIFGNLYLVGKEGDVGLIFMDVLGKTKFEYGFFYMFGIFCSGFLLRDLTTTDTNTNALRNNTNTEGDLFAIDMSASLSMQGVVLCGVLTGMCAGTLRGCIISTHLLCNAIGKQSLKSLTIVLCALLGAMSVPYMPAEVLQFMKGDGSEPLLADLFPGVTLPSMPVIFVVCLFIANSIIRMGKKRTVSSLLQNTMGQSSSLMSIGNMRHLSKYSIVYFMGLLQGAGYSLIGLSSPALVQSALSGNRESVLRLLLPLSAVGIASFFIYKQLREENHIPLYLLLNDEEKIALDYDESRAMSLEEQRKKVSVRSLLTYRSNRSSSGSSNGSSSSSSSSSNNNNNNRNVDGGTLVEGVFSLVLGMAYRSSGYSDITSAIVSLYIRRSEGILMFISAVCIGLAASTLWRGQ